MVDRFIYADIGAEGRMSDGGIYKRSTLSQALNTNSMNIPPAKLLSRNTTSVPHVILADEAFPLTTNIMRPYPQRDLDHSKRIFNYRLCRARRVIENSFGILAATWRIFSHRIELQPEKAKAITKACIVLHNFLISNKQPSNITVDTETTVGNWRQFPAPALVDVDRIPLRPSADAQEVRRRFTEHFMGVGSVPWQENSIC